MQKNKTLKGLLAVSAVAAMFSAFGVQAQTSGVTQQTPMTSGTSSTGKMNSAGKTTASGTIDNSNSTGMENRPDAGAARMDKMDSMGQSGSSGMTGSSSGKLSSADQKALKDMAQADINEVAAGKMAVSKASSSDVKAFAQQMVDDHGQALTKVQAVAQQKGVTLPTDVDSKHKAMSAKLEKMSGADFDKAYMQGAGVKDHSDVHSKLMADAKKIKDPDVKAVADAHMPVVEQHLKSAQQMASMKSGTTAGQ